MWTAKTTQENDRVSKYHFTENDKILSFREVIDLMQNSLKFRQFLTDVLRESPYAGYFWEVKPVMENRLDEDFEFVLVNAEIFTQLQPEKEDFEQYFERGKSVVAFPNLGRDAQLIAPTNIVEDECYTHLATFVRNAPEGQVEQFWKRVGEEYEAAIDDTPHWLSTSGLGVYWLHVRVDTRPKYYQYKPYQYVRQIEN